MSLRDMPWRERGKLAFQDGDSRDEPPYPTGQPETTDWHEGFDEAAAEAERSGAERLAEVSVRVQLFLEDGRLTLRDQRGRVLGQQAHVAIEQVQGDRFFTASVTFLRLKLVAVTAVTAVTDEDLAEADLPDVPDTGGVVGKP